MPQAEEFKDETYGTCGSLRCKLHRQGVPPAQAVCHGTVQQLPALPVVSCHAPFHGALWLWLHLWGLCKDSG